MAIAVYLQSLEGKKYDQVVDLDNRLGKLWPIGDASFSLLQYIDPYGNAIFNGAQMAEIQRELDILSAQANEDQKTVLQKVRQLSMRVQREPHTFLRFRGD